MNRVANDADMLVLVYFPRAKKVEFVSESVEWMFGIDKEKVMRNVQYFFTGLKLPVKDEIIENFCGGELLLAGQKYMLLGDRGGVRCLYVRTAPCGHGRNIMTIRDRTVEYELADTLRSETAALRREREQKEILLACLAEILREPEDEVTAASRKVYEMINDIVAATEPADVSEDQEIFSMDSLVKEMVDSVMSRMKVKGQRLELDLSLTDQALKGDRGKLKRVIWTLLENAMLYTPDGGTIKLKVSETMTENLAKDGRIGFLIVVEDDGIGIEKEFIPKLFQPFERADDPRVRSVQGNGLGLMVTKRIVEQMGGTIDVESEPDRGSSFKVFLDIASPEK